MKGRSNLSAGGLLYSILGLLLFPGLGKAAPPRGEAAYVEEKLKIDGVLDEAAWAEAVPIEAPGGQTRFLWSESGVYFSFSALEKTPAMGHAADGDSLHEEDVVELFVDQSGDHRQFVEIQVDPAGRAFLKNHILTAEPRVNFQGRLEQGFVESEMWRYVIPPPKGLLLASHLDRETGRWTVEMFLPASFVNSRRRGASMSPGIWRIHLVRNDWDKPKGERDRELRSTSWAPVLESHAHISPTRMGWLELKARK